MLDARYDWRVDGPPVQQGFAELGDVSWLFSKFKSFGREARFLHPLKRVVSSRRFYEGQTQTFIG